MSDDLRTVIANLIDVWDADPEGSIDGPAASVVALLGLPADVTVTALHRAVRIAAAVDEWTTPVPWHVHDNENTCPTCGVYSFLRAIGDAAARAHVRAGSPTPLRSVRVPETGGEG
jgi:hypothetical protein